MSKIGLIAIVMVTACGGSSNNTNNYQAAMTASNETSLAKPSTGSGTATFTVNGGTVSYTITYTGLTGTPNNAHLHAGDKSVPTGGGVVVPLPPPGGFAALPAGGSGSWSGTFTSANVAPGSVGGVTIAAGNLGDVINAMKSGSVYANVHTVGNASGEIRGQVNPQ
jgi:CHRD domain-containing protein